MSSFEIPEQPEENLEPERPEWLPDKFKNPEDLAKSYSELESKFGQTQQQLKEQQEQWESFLQEQEEQQQQAAQQQQIQQQVPQAQDQLYAAYEQDPLGTVAWLAQQQSQAAVQQALQQMAPQRQQQQDSMALVAGEIAFRDAERRYDDFDQYRAQIGEELKNQRLYAEDGFYDPQVLSSYIDSAYAKTKLAALTNGQASLEQQIQQQAHDDKVNAQTISGAAGRPETPDDNEEFYARLKRAANQNYSGWRGNA